MQRKNDYLFFFGSCALNNLISFSWSCAISFSSFVSFTCSFITTLSSSLIDSLLSVNIIRNISNSQRNAACNNAQLRCPSPVNILFMKKKPNTVIVIPTSKSSFSKKFIRLYISFSAILVTKNKLII